ncbi:hypothetical protein GCM10011515_03960 [Tsuneonella deserti]|jgi:hypothetical protein|uniref:Uncharacterized protein n=1 Tax=Tsuneonella deserti TaxID=2035528 RepID=A0ABQ1RYU1_9SPHN|nr:hypothetical protein [Tsuneonella deserti]GGD87594.1 hypothetical protein GCM10011515_03960 [Tsuneonella deserti]
MVNQREKAKAEFRRMMVVIVIIAVAMVIGALAWLHSQSQLTLHMVIASVLGVFFSVVLGTGLFALAFFSDKSGHDTNVTNASRRHNASASPDAAGRAPDGPRSTEDRHTPPG